MPYDTTGAAEMQRIDFQPSPSTWMQMQQCGRHRIVKWQEKPTKGHIKRLNKTEYVRLSDGEVLKYMAKNKDDIRRASLRRTFADLRAMIRANFEGGKNNQKMITLTYAENMMDTKKLYKDFVAFHHRLCRAFPDHKLEYIAVAEPQGRGAWHMHVLIKSDKPRWFVQKEALTAMWGHGGTYVEALRSDDVGDYYAAYFTGLLAETRGKTDPEAERAALELQRKLGDKSAKSIIKGGRLHFYPAGMRFYRRSRGIVMPEFDKAEFADALDGYKIKRATAQEMKIDGEHKNTYYQATLQKRGE